MQKIQATSAEAQSANLIAANIAQLKALFPELITEAANGTAVNVDVLKALVGDQTVTEVEEKYGLSWHGKRRARQLALAPSTGTLRPCREESVNWDTAKNLMIEGDNLEVLKLLQKSYAGKIKLIYIDPPYNTGKDFVYPDNFQDSIKNYLELTGQVQGGVKVSSNAETSGRFHTDWLSMIYPRLKLARQLLHDSGTICISIHYRELANLLRICDEIFGEENFVGNVTWKARVKPVNIGEAKYRPQGETEYLVIYQKSDSEGKFQPLFTGGIRSYPYELEGRKYRLTTILKSNRGTNYRSTMSFEIEGFTPADGQRWQAGEEEIKRMHNDNYIEFRDGTPFKRYFEDEEGAEHDPFYCFMENEWSSTSEAGKSELNDILGNEHGFDTVKPTRLIRTILQAMTRHDQQDIVLDFFAGSGTTGASTLDQNSADSGNRRFILVQLPEKLDPTNKDQRTMAEFCLKLGKPLTIAEITKERIRRAGTKVAAENPTFAGDTGFRVFKLDRSNIRAWAPDSENLEQTLFSHENHLAEGRTDTDVLYELLLKRGLDLCVPIASRMVHEKEVYAVGGGVLLACLAPVIALADVEVLAQGIISLHVELAPAGDSTCVFRDSAFADDVTKTNMAAILAQNGIVNVRSL